MTNPANFFRQGHKKLGGRKKGTPNKTDARKANQKRIFGDDFEAAIKELTLARLSPLEVINAIMFIKISKADYDGALIAAEKAAPYVHARLNATDVRVHHSAADRTDIELAADIVALRAKLQASRSLPPTIEMRPEAEAGAETSASPEPAASPLGTPQQDVACSDIVTINAEEEQ
jgi:hypothetical protein